MIAYFRNFLAGMKAAGAYGRSVKAQETGDSRKALEEGRRALRLLSRPFINREMPWIGVLVSMSVQMIDHHAYKMGESGASLQDLEFTLRFLRMNNEDPRKTDPKDLLSMQYLEARIAYLKNLHRP